MIEDTLWMQKALSLARKAEAQAEVPVGAVLVDAHGQLLSQAYNLRETLNTPLAHAETLAIHRASKKLKSWRLTGVTLFTTLEPCVMCAGVILQARISCVVFAAFDPKGGAMGSLYQLQKDSRLNHQVEIRSGILQDESAKLLKDFFQKRRSRENQNTP